MNTVRGALPYLPFNEYVPDGEPHLFGERVYLYGSHDRPGGYVFCQRDYVCWSAPAKDLTDQQCEGIIYRKTDDPENSDGSMCLYAPDVTQGPDGRYYLYYVLDHRRTVGVAVCDTPAGHYAYLGHVHYRDGTKLGEAPGDVPQFDPGVLYEDGRLYLVTGFCGQGDRSRPGAMLTVLSADMLTVAESPVCIVPGCEYAAGTDFQEHPFFEGPSLRKIDGRYHFIYSSLAMHELCDAVSDRINGPYRYQGVLISNADLGIDSYKPADKPTVYAGNNHGSILTVGGRHYIFYHRHTHGTWYSRQACAQPLTVLSNGSIRQAPVSSMGLYGKSLPARGEYPAHMACYLFGTDGAALSGVPNQVRIIPDPENSEYGIISSIHDGDTVGFHSFLFKDNSDISIETRGYGGGCFEIRTEYDGPVLGQIQLHYANIWTRFSAKIHFPDGEHRLFLTYHAPGYGDPEHVILQMRCIGF